MLADDVVWAALELLDETAEVVEVSNVLVNRLVEVVDVVDELLVVVVVVET